MLHMLLHRVVINQNVVYVYDHKIIKPFPENVVHNVQDVVGVSVSPKGITNNLYEPYLVWQTIFFLFFSTIWIW
jgi:hypothetical protein